MADSLSLPPFTPLFLFLNWASFKQMGPPYELGFAQGYFLLRGNFALGGSDLGLCKALCHTAIDIVNP